MKKLIASILYISSSFAHANIEDYACVHLLVTIKNHTNRTCYLLQDELKYARIFLNDIPFKILPSQTAPLLDLMQNNVIANIVLDLQYECGEGNYITLHAEKNACSNQNNTYAHVANTKNLKAEVETQTADYWSNKYASVVWTIYS